MGEAKRRNKHAEHRATGLDSYVQTAENFRFDFPVEDKRQIAANIGAVTAIVEARLRAGEPESLVFADIFAKAPMVFVAWPDKAEPLGFAVGIAKGMERARRGIALGLTEDIVFTCVPTFSEKHAYELALLYGGDVRTFTTPFDSNEEGAREAAFRVGRKTARAGSIRPRS